MAESCTNTEDQGSSLCGLEMTCTSNTASSLKKQLNHSSQDSSLDDSLLHRDSIAAECGSIAYKASSDNGYADSSEPMEMSVSGNCVDVYMLSDSHKTDKGIISSKDSALLLSQTLNSGSLARSSPSSAFMISSLLSTKSVTSLTTMLTQACAKQNPQLTVTKSSTNCISLPSAVTESNARSLESKQNSHYQSDKVLVGNSLDLAEDSLDGSRHSSDLQLNEEQISLDVPAEIQNDTNGISSDDALISDVEDLQMENTSPVIVKGSEAANPIMVGESVASLSEVKTKDLAVEKPASSPRADFHDKSDVSDSELRHSEGSDTAQAHDLTDEDILVIDENIATDVVGSTSETDMIDASGRNTPSKVVTEDPEDLTVVNKGQNIESRDTFSNNQLNPDEVSGSSASQELADSDDSIVDIFDLDDSSQNVIIQTPERLHMESAERKGAVANTDVDMKTAKFQTNVKNDLIVATESEELEPDTCKRNSVADVVAVKLVGRNTEDDVNPKIKEVKKFNMSLECDEDNVTNQLSACSTNVKDTLIGSSETSSTKKETHTHLGPKALDKEINMDKIQDNDTSFLHETNSGFEGHSLSGRKDSFIDQDKSEDGTLFASDTSKSQPAKNAEKYSFKNILLMPKNTTPQKSTSVVQESECAKSAETIVLRRSATAASDIDETVRDKQDLVLSSQSSQALCNDVHIKTEVTESVDTSTVNERKRFQAGDFTSACKRSKMDSVADNEEKIMFVDAAKVSESIPVEKKYPPSVDSKGITKSKDDKPVLLSNEVLQSLITLRVKAFIKNQKQANLDRLNLRTRGMQSASNLWKETAKHLEKSVLELTSLNQKLESRRAHLIAVKRLASRTISTQTGEDNVSSSSISSPAFSSPASNPVQRTTPVTTYPTVYRTGRPGRPPLYARPAPIPPATPPPPPPPVATAPAVTTVDKASSNKSTDSSAHTNSVNLIDLTDDEDTSKNVIAKTTKTGASQAAGHSPSKHHAGIKSGPSSSTANGYVRQSSQVQGGASGSQISQSSISGSHHTSNTGDTQSHLVNASNSTGQHSSATTNPAGSRQSNSRNLAQNSSAATSANSAANAVKTAAPLSLPPSFLISNKHPAPLPSNMDTGNAPPTAKKRPPKPSLKISRVSQGIVLSWNMPSLFDVEKISSYQLYAYQESESATPRSNLWKKVGEVTALPLPMACTLTQFQEGNKYHFAVRAVDQFGRCGSYSDPSSIYLGPKS